MSEYEYLVRAKPCGCEMIAYEDKMLFQELKSLGTGMSCHHDNTYEAISVIDPSNRPEGLIGGWNC
jgi:hypothetical protein